MINKSVSEPISIINTNKTLVPAYSQSEAIVQNTPPKHSVIDFSSYLIRKPNESTTDSQNFTQHQSKFTESVHKTCSMTTSERHDFNHVTNVMTVKTCSSSEMVLTENTVVKPVENMCNRDLSVSADYAQPDKSANRNESKPYSSTPVELLSIPEDDYFWSNLSDKLSDYEDIWKYAESNVGSVQAGIVQRLQPSLVSITNNNNITKGQTPSTQNGVFIEKCFTEKCFVTDLDININSVSHEISEMTSKSLLHMDQSAMLPNGSAQHDVDTSTTTQILQCDKQNETSCSECLTGEFKVQGLDETLDSGGFDAIQEDESDLDSNHSNCDDDDNGDADTEEGDVLPKINSVHTQTSPSWKTKNQFSRKSASTSSLSTMRNPVYSEPFDAISPNEKSEVSNKNPNHKLPKKVRRKSAPASSHTEKRFWKNDNNRNLSISEMDNDVISKPAFEDIEEHEEVFQLSGEHDSKMVNDNTQKSKLEKFYDTAWVEQKSHVDIVTPHKPKPSPRKTKQKKITESALSNEETVRTVSTDNNVISNPAKFTIDVLEQIETLQEFEKSHDAPSSPVLNKFPVYDRQISMETRISYSEGLTAEDMISSWNPELTLKPVKPFPVLAEYSAMSEYDNLNNTLYMAPSGQSVASVGTIFSKPWENSVLGKIMRAENGLSQSKLTVKPSPLVQNPSSLLPPLNMLERIKEWQKSSQEYHEYLTQTSDKEYSQSVSTDVNSLDAITSRDEMSCNSEFRISSNGQNSQSSEKTLVNEKSPSHSHVTHDKICESIPGQVADLREKVAPVLGRFID